MKKSAKLIIIMALAVAAVLAILSVNCIATSPDGTESAELKKACEKLEEYDKLVKRLYKESNDLVSSWKQQPVGSVERQKAHDIHKAKLVEWSEACKAYNNAVANFNRLADMQSTQ
ncbi:MAG TPA: hypothetical protein O0X32_02515 [Methanocorpusculum sp.]|nr:hypothetical protein [Methanocorpusculum sp.]